MHVHLTSKKEFLADRRVKISPSLLGSATQTDFPGRSCRIGSVLHFVFPIRHLMECPEDKCQKVFPIRQWGDAKRAMRNHLRMAHQLFSLEVVRWCSHCRSPTSKKISNHGCLRSNGFYRIPESEVVGNLFECKASFYNCARESVLLKHSCLVSPGTSRVPIQGSAPGSRLQSCLASHNAV